MVTPPYGIYVYTMVIFYENVFIIPLSALLKIVLVCADHIFDV